MASGARGSASVDVDDVLSAVCGAICVVSTSCTQGQRACSHDQSDIHHPCKLICPYVTNSIPASMLARPVRYTYFKYT
eukprot:1991837-Heterocapsa_arctica.AAC.1